MAPWHSMEDMLHLLFVLQPSLLCEMVQLQYSTLVLRVWSSSCLLNEGAFFDCIYVHEEHGFCGRFLPQASLSHPLSRCECRSRWILGSTGWFWPKCLFPSRACVFLCVLTCSRVCICVLCVQVSPVVEHVWDKWSNGYHNPWWIRCALAAPRCLCSCFLRSFCLLVFLSRIIRYAKKEAF